MEILRLPPYPISTTWDVPSPNTAYNLYIEDLIDHSVETQSVTSSASSQITYDVVQSKAIFDRKFLFRILDTSGGIVLDSNLDVLRPYIDYRTLGTTASEIQEYKILELVARSLIDAVITDGFYNNKHIVEVNGSGADYMPIWEDANKVLKVYENNELIFDVDTPEDNEYTYLITLDNSSIIRVENGKYNRSQAAPLELPLGGGDLIFLTDGSVAFPKLNDYIFVLDIGYKAVPPDVEYATKLLIEDLKCGKLDYFKRHVKSYDTDQFKIQFTSQMLDGTGNMIVDKILSKYTKTITKIGMV